MRYKPGPGLKVTWFAADSSVGELVGSDARKAFRTHVWKAPAAGYAKRGEEEKAVLRVGKGGRGFVVETTDKKRYVLTVAHCLPKIAGRDLPPAHPGRYPDECTYKKLLAPLGQKPAVIAQCLFVDPISDLAILGQPDNEVFEEAAAAYNALVEGRPALKISQRVVEYDHSPDKGAPGSLLSLEGHWYSCAVHPRGASLQVTATAQPIRSGMSGSPILDADGDAIGAVSTGDGIFPNPRLLGALPGWFLAKAVKGGSLRPPASNRARRGRAIAAAIIGEKLARRKLSAATSASITPASRLERCYGPVYHNSQHLHMLQHPNCSARRPHDRATQILTYGYGIASPLADKTIASSHVRSHESYSRAGRG